MRYVYVAIGVVFGSLSRYALAFVIPMTGFRWHTLFINNMGSFLLGVIAFHPTLANKWRYLLGIGFLGSFTTFSTFSVDSLKLIFDRKWLAALLYILANVILCLIAIHTGLTI